MNIRRAMFLELLLCDEHRVETAERCQYRPAHPRRKLSLRRIEDIYLHSRRSQCDYLLLQSFLEIF